MKSDAGGQLLGYSLQFPRALCHLLQVPPGGSVGVEVLGDVATFFPEGMVLTEEDKSSIIGNPLTDRSINLWKTFYNWINAILEGELDLEKTKFLLYSNQSGNQGIINDFDSVSTKQNADDAIARAKESLSEVTETHAIWKYYDLVLNKNADILVKVLQRFELRIGNDASYDEVKTALVSKLIPDYCIEFLMDKLGGWLQRHINESIARGEPALISFELFNKEFQAFFLKIRQQSLIDWASQNPPCPDDISGAIKIRPTYIRQLELVTLPKDEIIEAVSDYIRADTNRNIWIENGTLDEDTAKDFENRLLSLWDNTRKEIKITKASLPENERGQLLLTKCQSKQVTIRGEEPPDRTIHGTYHALADIKTLGWHPRWEDLMNTKGGSNGSNN